MIKGKIDECLPNIRTASCIFIFTFHMKMIKVMSHKQQMRSIIFGASKRNVFLTTALKSDSGMEIL